MLHESIAACRVVSAPPLAIEPNAEKNSTLDRPSASLDLHDKADSDRAGHRQSTKQPEYSM